MYQPRLAHMPEHVHDKKEKEKNAPKDCETAQAKKLRRRSETRTSTKLASLLNLQTDYLW